MPTLKDTGIKLSTYTVAKVIFNRNHLKIITSIYAFDKFGELIYHYTNPYGVRSNQRANALRTNVLQHSSAFYFSHNAGLQEIYLNNRLQLIKKHTNERD